MAATTSDDLKRIGSRCTLCVALQRMHVATIRNERLLGSR